MPRKPPQKYTSCCRYFWIRGQLCGDAQAEQCQVKKFCQEMKHNKSLKLCTVCVYSTAYLRAGVRRVHHIFLEEEAEYFLAQMYHYTFQRTSGD